ncbi:MAG: hypothetical protein WC717_01520 [Candidatus Micrarchaeia archaeon]|jgi:hypothetical protein
MATLAHQKAAGRGLWLRSPVPSTRAGFAKFRFRARQVWAAGVFFNRISYFEHLLSLEGGTEKLSRREQKNLESGKTGAKVLTLSQYIWEKGGNLQAEGIMKMAKADEQLGFLVGTALSAALAITGIASALTSGPVYMTYTLLPAAVVLFVLMYPRRNVDEKAEKARISIEKARKRANA